MPGPFDINGPHGYFFQEGNSCTSRNIKNLLVVEYLLLWHHKHCSYFEGMCRFNITDESASMEADIQHLEGLKHQIKQPTGGAWLVEWLNSLTGWMEHPIQSIVVVICSLLFLCVYYVPLNFPALHPTSPDGHLQLCQSQWKWCLKQGGGIWENDGTLVRIIDMLLPMPAHTEMQVVLKQPLSYPIAHYIHELASAMDCNQLCPWLT